MRGHSLIPFVALLPLGSGSAEALSAGDPVLSIAPPGTTRIDFCQTSLVPVRGSLHKRRPKEPPEADVGSAPRGPCDPAKPCLRSPESTRGRINTSEGGQPNMAQPFSFHPRRFGRPQSLAAVLVQGRHSFHVPVPPSLPPVWFSPLLTFEKATKELKTNF